MLELFIQFCPSACIAEMPTPQASPVLGITMLWIFQAIVVKQGSVRGTRRRVNIKSNKKA